MITYSRLKLVANNRNNKTKDGCVRQSTYFILFHFDIDVKDFNILVLIIILIIYVEPLPPKLTHMLHMSRNSQGP